MGPDEQLNGAAQGTESSRDAGADEREAALPVILHDATPAARPMGVRRVAPLSSLSQQRRTGLPVVQAAAVAAGSFVAGAAVAGFVHRRQRAASPAVAGGRFARALGRRRGQRAAKGPELVQIVGSRSLLVDVHLLGLPASER